MFRPNRIGTPVIHQDEGVADTSAFTMSTSLITSAIWDGNCINATPVLDFGRSALYWGGTARTIPLSSKWAIAQQFTVSEPQSGDVVGVELNGSIMMQTLSTMTAMPFLAKLSTVGTSLLDNIEFVYPTMLNGIITITTNRVANRVYRDIAVIRRDDDGVVAGTYAHGIVFFEASNTPAAVTFDVMYAAMSVRQLNDQQSIGYRDTLR